MSIRINMMAVSVLALLGAGCATQSGTPALQSPAPVSKAQSATALPTICNQTVLACLTGEYSLIIGPSGQVETYAGLIEEAEKRYAKTFKAPRTKSVLFLSSTVSQDDRQILKDSGYEVLLPWVSGIARQAMARDAIRVQIKSRNSDANDAEIETMTEAMLQRAGLGLGVNAERGAIAHEFAHMWFIKNNWPQSEDESEDEDQDARQYGSAGPDWLDEMAAVLSENDFLTAQRREATKEIVDKGNLEAFWPLETYFTMEHPIFKQALAMLKARGDLKDGMNVVMLTADEARGLDPEGGRKSPHFYAQSRAFADFMIETSKTPFVFDRIAHALGTGMTMEAWLSENGQEYGLKTNVPDLQKQWELWLVKG
ncbi:MAG: hypothetical protein COB36_12440 [Alphaproteobacteria bacterium]|nr:MAG: hypothetical protein COB36_12440 [Alphaproteobacteria bacterium]